MEITGNEGLIDGIKSFVSKIIEKLVQAAKWVWNLITGGGNNKSVSDLSKEVDKELKKAEQTIQELAKAEEKLYGEVKHELNEGGVKEVFKELEKIDFNDPNSFENYMLDDGRTARQAADTMLLGVLGKERYDSFKKNTSKNLSEASGGSISPAKAKKEGLKVAVAAAMGKPLPKKTGKSLTGVEELKTGALWCFRSQAVCEAAKKHPDVPVPVELVNKAVVETFGNMKAAYEFQIESLNQIKLLNNSDRANITKEQLVQMATTAFNTVGDKELPFWYGETQYFIGSLDHGKMGMNGVWGHKGDGTPTYPGKVCVDLTTFEILNQQIKSVAQLMEKTKSSLKRVNSWLFELSKENKEERNKQDGELKETREMGAYYMLIYHYFNSLNLLVMKLDSNIRVATKYASTPLEHLN